MEVTIVSDADAAAALVAQCVGVAIQRKPALVLGLATGRTMLPVYEKLIEAYKEKKASFANVVTFNLDEFVGLDHRHPASYFQFMHEEFFRHINIPLHRTHLLNGTAEDLDKECEQFEESIKKSGGIDLQLLGLGTNGHIAFNEPSSSLASRTRVKTLMPESIEHNKSLFQANETTPEQVLTMGIGTILESRRVLLLATGESKAPALAQAVEGPLTSMVPASALQLHPHCKVICDEAAASCLKLQKYYREIRNKTPKGMLGWELP